MTSADATPLTLNRDHMKALREMVYAAEQNPWRPILSTVHIAIEKDQIVLTATDSCMIVRRFLTPEIPAGWADRTFLLNAAELERALVVMLRDKTEQSVTLTEVEGSIRLGWSYGTWRLPQVEGKFPDCDGFVTGFESGSLDQVALNPRLIERMARALGVWPFKHSEGFCFEFSSDAKPVRVTDYRRTGQDFGLLMPVRRNPS